MSRLFTPLRLREISFRNRVWMSPMCQYSAQDGVPNTWHLVHLGSRAVGGAGLVMVEATAVAPDGRISAHDLGLWNDAQADAFAPIAAFVRAQGAVAGIQLGHAGRKASTAAPWDGGAPVAPAAGGWGAVAPSPIPFDNGYLAPHALTEPEIHAVVHQFGAAVKRAHAAGFQAIELHMAHGYLLHQFLSPLSNQRTDAWGGSLENRMRLPLAVAGEARQAWPADLPLLVRISATDWVDGGWNVESSLELAGRLKELGVDLVDCSSGGSAPAAKVPAGPGFQAEFAARIRKEIGIATGAVGLVTEPAQAEHILVSGQADVVLLARELLRNPYWPLTAARRLGDDVSWPRQYLRAKR